MSMLDEHIDEHRQKHPNPRRHVQILFSTRDGMADFGAHGTPTLQSVVATPSSTERIDEVSLVRGFGVRLWLFWMYMMGDFDDFT